MVARSRKSWDWEPWEARRRSEPTGPTWEVREARQDARLLLLVVRARFAEGTVPFEHAEALARVAEDDRVNVRQRRVAAGLLTKLRVAGLSSVQGRRAGTSEQSDDGTSR